MIQLLQELILMIVFYMYQQEHVGRTDITLLFVNLKTLKSKDKIIQILIFDTSF